MQSSSEQVAAPKFKQNQIHVFDYIERVKEACVKHKDTDAALAAAGDSCMDRATSREMVHRLLTTGSMFPPEKDGEAEAVEPAEKKASPKRRSWGEVIADLPTPLSKNETWRRIPKHGNYAVSDFYRVMRVTPGRSTEAGRVVKPKQLWKKGRRPALVVTILDDGGQRRTLDLLRLVFNAFRGGAK